MAANTLLLWILTILHWSFSNGSSSSPPKEPTMVDKKDFNIFPLPRSTSGEPVVAPCDAWTYLSWGDSVKFQSPEYPAKYNRRSHCKWVFIAVGSGAKLNINCDIFHLRHGRQSSSCYHSFIDLLFIGITTRLPNMYCDETGPQNLKSIFNWAYVLFRPSLISWDSTYQGFSCTVSNPDLSATTIATPETCKCGRKGASTPTPRIAGGMETGIHEFPWQAAIVALTDETSVICGAIVINNLYVLTAARCVDRTNFEDDFQVAFGEHDLSVGNETSETVYRRIESIISHPEFNTQSGINDIALVKLVTPIDLEDTIAIKPACLPDSSRDYADIAATVTGWGLKGPSGPFTSVLNEVDLTVINNTYCDQQHTFLTISAGMICATGNGDTCMRDGGGALVIKDGDHYEVIGIAPQKLVCDNGLPGIYTRVSSYLDWIQSNTVGATTCPE